jgi:hypothetical protein
MIGDHFPPTAQGFADASAYAKSLGQLFEDALQREQSVDGWTAHALANLFWRREHDPS